MTLREYLEAIRDRCEPYLDVAHTADVYAHAVAALKLLDASSTAEGALQTDVYRIVADDPHRSPERIAR